MAKVAEKPAPPKARRLMSWLLWGVIGLLAVAAGVALPFLVSLKGLPFIKDTSASKQKTVYVKFDDVIVPIKEGNGSLFIKIKMLLAMDGPQKEMDALILLHKPRLKDWLIGYLADKSLKELQGTAAQNRIRREVKLHFNERVFEDGPEKISDILFDEYHIGR